MQRARARARLVSLPYVLGSLPDNNTPNNRNDKVPFIRRRGEVVKKLEGQGVKIVASHFFYTELFSLLVNIVVVKKIRLRFCACGSVASLFLESINNPVMVLKEVR